LYPGTDNTNLKNINDASAAIARNQVGIANAEQIIAEQNQELAILAINTFLMDLKGTNSKIRGLALRGLCSLKFDGVLEYMQQGIDLGLQDLDPYVKKTAIIGCIKMYHHNKQSFKKNLKKEKLFNE
jgi:vesicle coat complex subunit